VLGRKAPESPWAPTDGRDFLDHLIEQNLPFSRGRQEATAEFDRRFVKRMLDVHQGDIGKAASASGSGVATSRNSARKADSHIVGNVGEFLRIRGAARRTRRSRANESFAKRPRDPEDKFADLLVRCTAWNGTAVALYSRS
jgi:hypothetical protein